MRAAREADFDAVRALLFELNPHVLLVEYDVARIQWRAVLDHAGTTVFGAEVDGVLVSTVTLHLLPNMTYGGLPYALIENVVTAEAHRGKGIAQAVMRHAMAAAWTAKAYKIMLLTGRERGAKGFYEKLGFRCGRKIWDDLSPHAMRLEKG